MIRASRPGCVVGGGGHSRLDTGASIDRIGGRQRPPVTINWHARERGKSHGHSTGTREWREIHPRTFVIIGRRSYGIVKARDSSALN